MDTQIRNFYSRYLKIPKPYEHQLKVWHLMEEGKFPILVRAPTGSGKTESVVAPFLNQFVTQDFYIAPRLIYVLPTRVLVNSLKDRIKKYASEISDDISVVAHHGAQPDSAFFMEDIIVTTLDQFLYGYARSSVQVGRHIDLPAGTIATSLVVFDEAHMYHDKYTFAILRALLEILYNSKVPFVVMTATLPKTLEESLFQDIEIPEESKILASVPRSNKLRYEIVRSALLENDKVCLPKDLIEKIKEKKTLIVVNRVDTAQKLYLKLKEQLAGEGIKPVLLHSRYIKKDRDEHEKEALSKLNVKENNQVKKREGPAVVISTQVLEAGVDFSAELLITEIAPADSLVQRIGRCARYEGEEGEVYIFSNNLEGSDSTTEEQFSITAPYESKHISRTLKKLSENNLDLTSFEQIIDFVNVLEYVADDFEAQDALIDLFECTLYADEKPENIQARNSKIIRLIVIDPEKVSANKGVGREVEKIVNQLLESKNFEQNLMNLQFESFLSFVRRILKQKGGKFYIYKLVWKPDDRTFEVKVKEFESKSSSSKDGNIININPYEMYAIGGNYYDKELGLILGG